MVLLIKDDNKSETFNIPLICKMMLNIEQNKNIYNINGNLNKKNISNESFNHFTHEQVDYDISVSMGTILLYLHTPSIRSISDGEIFQDIISQMRTYHNSIEPKVPIKLQNYKSTNYTLISKKPSSKTNNAYNNSQPRKFISNSNEIKRAYESGSRFVWLVKIVKQAELHISELNRIHVS